MMWWMKSEGDNLKNGLQVVDEVPRSVMVPVGADGVVPDDQLPCGFQTGQIDLQLP